MANLSLQSRPLLVLVIDRQAILTNRLDGALRTLSGCLQSAESVRRHAGALELRIEGYGHDTRKLHEFPEVRRFIQALHERFPYWIHFATKTGPGLALIQLCLLENISTHDDGAGTVPDDALSDLQALLLEQLRATQHLYGQFDITAAEFNAMTAQLSAYMARCAELF